MLWATNAQHSHNITVIYEIQYCHCAYSEHVFRVAIVQCVQLGPKPCFFCVPTGLDWSTQNHWSGTSYIAKGLLVIEVGSSINRPWLQVLQCDMLDDQQRRLCVYDTAGPPVHYYKMRMKKNSKCIRTKTLMAMCLLAMSLLTTLSIYTAIRCFSSKDIDGIFINADPTIWCNENVPRLKKSQTSDDLHAALNELKGSGNRLEWKSELRQEVTSNLESHDRRLKDIYDLKYTELRELNLLDEYPIHRPCLQEKKPAVPCYDTECNTSLPLNPGVGINSLLQVTRNARGRLQNPLKPIIANLPNSHVTIVAAASANHFLEIQAMIATLHKNVFPNFRNVSFYFYDMGLASYQVAQMKRHCRCHVLKFPFEELAPSISNISCYTWKPLIIHAHLPKTNILIWADASVRFNTTKNDQLFDDVTKKGVLVSLSERYVRPVAHHTAQTTFNYFDVTPCSVANFQELEASFMAFHNQDFTRDIIVESWTACALDPNCMCPEGSLSMHHCDGAVRQYSKCHRFDQSAITLIMLKLFHENYSTFLFNHTYYAVQRGNKLKYFDDLDMKVLK